MLHYVTKNDKSYISKVLNTFAPAFPSFMVRFAKIFGTYAFLSFLINVLHLRIEITILRLYGVMKNISLV